MKRFLFLFLVFSHVALFSGSMIQKPIRKFRLKSGLNLIFQENKRSDLVNVSFAVKIPAYNNNFSSGTAYLLGEYLRRHDKDLIHFLVGKGIPVHGHSFSIHNEYLKVWFSFLKQDTDEAMDAIFGNYFHPKWDKVEFEKIKESIKQN
ncbi:hypothetical protein MJH12_16910 [bacterium]|nr:hypothetical protein [bacterium]